MSTVLDHSSRATPAMMANRRYRIAVQDLQLNMFVVELDRPWLDTPFLLQGFLIDDQVELDTLVRYCNYVYVDLEMSSPNVAMAIRIADANFGRHQQLDAEPLTRPFGPGHAQMNAHLESTAALHHRPGAARHAAGAGVGDGLRVFGPTGGLARQMAGTNRQAFDNRIIMEGRQHNS